MYGSREEQIYGGNKYCRT